MKTPASLTLAAVIRILGVPARWTILRELAQGQALPVSELARRTRCTPSMTSKHMLVLRKAGLVRRVYGRLYQLAPEWRPADGATHLDLGHCLIPLAPPGDGAGA